MITSEEAIKVINANEAGKIIQCRDPSDIHGWQDTPLRPGPCFDFARYEYRIKPEPPKPRDFWLYTLDGISVMNVLDEYAMASFKPDPRYADRKCELIHLREVLPDEEGKA